ncbi:hypothetical protein BS47DRAFT_660044 [Hydnum rufescens UP504]|uniref:25S rRNA adenine-N(1) methyltransferase n=1 Tax=Hydnum rufescens UP504 TaxID=1448309 RepID=A0A9P6AES6_9AGAM|nr:hypothetical protein BS47DRAFT_660044 [Hydnum rufescens UP504]
MKTLCRFKYFMRQSGEGSVDGGLLTSVFPEARDYMAHKRLYHWELGGGFLSLSQGHTLYNPQVSYPPKAREKLDQVRKEMERIGGLKVYQEMSSIGQGSDRGGGIEKVLVEWLPGLLPETHGKGKGKEKLKLLEVGALKPDNYDRYRSWISNTPIDLRSRHPLIKQQDFLQIDVTTNAGQWDVISLSLVLNFVPQARDRGKMLRLAHTFLRTRGLLFIVLPLPCVQNSRYLDFQRLTEILAALSVSGEQTHLGEETLPPELTAKRTLRTGDRNNFAILL